MLNECYIKVRIDFIWFVEFENKLDYNLDSANYYIEINFQLEHECILSTRQNFLATSYLLLTIYGICYLHSYFFFFRVTLIFINHTSIITLIIYNFHVVDSIIKQIMNI